MAINNVASNIGFQKCGKRFICWPFSESPTNIHETESMRPLCNLTKYLRARDMPQCRQYIGISYA